MTPLRSAARDGLLEEVKRITEEDASEDEDTPAGWTAVQWAALRNRAEVVLYLLGAGVWEAAWDDAAVNDMEMLREAFDGMESTRPFCLHGSPLCLASLRGHEETVRALLEAGEGGSLEEGTEGCGTALMLASDNGHTAVARALLAAGADVRAADAMGWTALFFASRHGHTSVVEALLAAGADVNAADTDSSLFDADADGSTALMLASLHGHTAVVRALLAARADVRAADAEGWTALMLASEHGHTSVVEALLAAGADVSATDPDDWTPLMRASLNGHTAVVHALLKAGADVARALPDVRRAPAATLLSTTTGHR